jgi:ABC transport system ATP-binding/permease protein
MPIVAAHGISKAYGTQVLLRSADLTVRAADRLGVVGRNGAGKSTLGRILAGLDSPDQGHLSRRRNCRILVLEQVPRLEPCKTAAQVVESGLEAWVEAVELHRRASDALSTQRGDVEALIQEQASAAEDVERLGGWDQRHRVRSILDFLGIRHVDARVSQLSGGEQRRVALARLLIARPDLAILDEPTNHLDADIIEWLERYLVQEYSGALLLITHDRYLLDRVATRTVEIAHGELYFYEGGYGRYLEQKAQREELAARTEQNRQNFLRRELEWLHRQPKARTTKQAARVERAQAALAADRPQREQTVQMAVDVARPGKTVLELKGLSVGIGGRRLCEPFDWSLVAGERVGIVGPNGAGKTTFLRTLLGEVPPYAGSITLGKNTRLAYLDQQRMNLNDAASVFENIIGDQTRLEIAGQPIDPYAYLDRFGFGRQEAQQPVGSLSGGERARVALGRLLRQSANLLVLDEPTNDLDVTTLGALEAMLVDSGATVLIVTHDRWLLDRVATSLMVWSAGAAKVTVQAGNFTSYKRLQELDRPPPIVATGERSSRRGSGRTEVSRAVKTKGLSFAEARELDGIMPAIAAAEQAVATLAARLSDPATYTAGGKDIAELQGALEAAKSDVDRLMSRWEELENKRTT